LDYLEALPTGAGAARFGFVRLGYGNSRESLLLVTSMDRDLVVHPHATLGPDFCKPERDGRAFAYTGRVTQLPQHQHAEARGVTGGA